MYELYKCIHRSHCNSTVVWVLQQSCKLAWTCIHVVNSPNSITILFICFIQFFWLFFQWQFYSCHVIFWNGCYCHNCAFYFFLSKNIHLWKAKGLLLTLLKVKLAPSFIYSEIESHYIFKSFCDLQPHYNSLQPT